MNEIMSEDLNEQTKRHSTGPYGEPTVARRIPVSILPIVDKLLEKLRESAKNIPSRTISRVIEAAKQERGL